MFANVPEVKPGIIAVSRDCFPISLSKARREAGCNALLVFLGNFGPENPFA